MSGRFVMYIVCVHSALYTICEYLSIPLETPIYVEILLFQIKKYITFFAKYEFV